MLHPSTQKLIDRLAEMTDRGRLGWTKTDQGQLSYTTEGYSVSITGEPHELIIFSKAGDELERASAPELAETPTETDGTYRDVLIKMHRQASRIARGTEAAISSLLADIDTEEEVEPTAEEEPTALETAPDEPEVTIDETSPEVLPEEARPDPQPEDDTELTAAEESEESAEDDSEPDVSGAVARMADEVNQREAERQTNGAGELTAAAMGLAASVDHVENTAETVEEAEEAVAETEPEEIQAFATPPVDEVPFTPETVEAAEAPVDESPEPQAEPEYTSADTELETVAEPASTFEYSPFGMSEPTPDAEPVIAESETLATEPEAEPIADPVTPYPDQTEEAPTFASETPGEANIEVETDLDTEPMETESPGTGDESTSFTPLEPEAVSVPEESVTFTAQDEPEAMPEVTPATDEVTESPVDETIVETAESETPTAPGDNVFAFTPSTPVAEPVQEEAAVEPEPQQAAEEAESEPEEAPADDQPAPPQTYSLSGIGAGFGLGALSATTEASGIPSANSNIESVSEPQEKIVIDATDDVPLSDEPAEPEPFRTADPLPDMPSLDTPDPFEAEADPAETPEESSSEDDDLKPRTRFNPWN